MTINTVFSVETRRRWTHKSFKHQHNHKEKRYNIYESKNLLIHSSWKLQNVLTQFMNLQCINTVHGNYTCIKAIYQRSRGQKLVSCVQWSVLSSTQRHTGTQKCAGRCSVWIQLINLPTRCFLFCHLGDFNVNCFLFVFKLCLYQFAFEFRASNSCICFWRIVCFVSVWIYATFTNMSNLILISN